MKGPIRQKSQIIDDDSEFRIQELQTLAKQTNRLHPKQYQIVSIIGSQSSGKSTLLNALFKTDFDVLNRQQRVGQTTKGIWFSVETPSNIIILDVEGSDSRERQDRTKIQRQNSLFAFAISHTLLINIWTHQVGTWKGAQLQILQIVLELNLKLFGAEKPKQIVFVVRDFVQKRQNPQACKQKLVERVKKAWSQIPKPSDKANVKLEDVFDLNVFFLPSKLQEREKQAWQSGIGKVKKFLQGSTKNKDLVTDNIPVNDLPIYMQNIWTTIKSDKDINLPQQKVLLSAMRCQQIKKMVYETYMDEFRDQMDKSERIINLDFKRNITQIVGKMIGDYSRETVGYIEEEVEKIQEELVNEIQDKIEESFHKQGNLIADDCLRDFSDVTNKIFSKDKNMDQIKEEKNKIVQKFANQIARVCYLPEWEQVRVNRFKIELEKKYSQLVVKIINDSIKEFMRILKKQTENAVSNCFYDRQTFTNKFWPTLSEELKKVGFKARNSIQLLFKSLGQGQKREQQQKYIHEAQEYASQQLRNYVKLKCIDLRYFIMKHFESQFNNQGDVPRQWPTLTEDAIKVLFDELKKKYMALVADFRQFGVEKVTAAKIQNNRVSSINMSNVSSENDKILAMKEEQALIKRLDEEMAKVHEQALRKHKETYTASIPTWAYVVLGIAAFDDVLLWFTSPVMAIPVTIILLLVVLAFFFGGKSLLNKLFGVAKDAAEGAVASATRSAASSIMRKSQ